MDGEFDAFLTSGELAFGTRDAALLRAIDAEGSLNAAAGSLERSYSRAHERIGALEAEFGALVDRTRGGSGGGGSALTERAWDLLARFDRLQVAVSDTIDAEKVVLAGEIAERDGELASCETAVGTIRALAPAEADRVQIAIRADAITLHAPAEAPPATGTSARNRLDGVIEDMELEASVARVLFAPADTDGPSIVALVTVDSLDRLALSVGDSIVATWKATATRATARR